MKDLTKGSIGKQILLFSIPIMLGCIFQMFYNLADTRIVGSIQGKNALAAVGATTSLSNLIIGFLTGMTNGFSILIARTFGGKFFEDMKKAVSACFSLGVIVTGILTIISVGFLPQILSLMNMPEKHMQEGTEYIRIILAGMMITMFYNLFAGMLRAIGDSVAALVFLVLSTILNVILDLLMVPGMGVRGAAFATIISQLFSVLLCILYIWKKYELLHPVKKYLFPTKELTTQMLANGFSMGFMSSFVSFGSVVLQGSINTFGTNIIVSHSASRRLTEFFMLPFSIFGMTMTTFCSQNMGAEKYDRIRRGLHLTLVAVWIWCTLVIVISFSPLTPVLIQMITSTNEPEVLNTSHIYMKVNTPLYYITTFICIFRNALQGIGDRITPMVSSAIEMFGKIAIVIFLTPYWGYYGIMVSEPLVWIVMVIPLCVQYVKNPVFRKR